MRHIFYCKDCDIYSMNEICKVCNKKIVSTKPPKYSLSDPYGVQRRIAKKEIEQKNV